MKKLRAIPFTIAEVTELYENRESPTLRSKYHTWKLSNDYNFFAYLDDTPRVIATCRMNNKKPTKAQTELYNLYDQWRGSESYFIWKKLNSITIHQKFHRGELTKPIVVQHAPMTPEERMEQFAEQHYNLPSPRKRGANVFENAGVG